MAAVKVQVVRKKILGDFEAQSHIKDRPARVLWAIGFILLLAALSSVVYFVSLMFVANEDQVSHGGDNELYARPPGCGYMLMVPNNESRYVRYPELSNPFVTGNRCAFVVFGATREVKISFANYSFQPSSNAEFIVAELSDEGGDELKYSKLDFSIAVVAKVPSVIYYTSDTDEKQSKFFIQVSPMESSGSSTGIPGRASMMPYTKTGATERWYPHSALYPMAYLAVFEASPTSQPDRLFTCSPHNSICCNAMSLYRLPSRRLGIPASRLTGLSKGGVEVSSEVTVVLMFCLPSDFDASANGSTCRVEWHAKNETTTEVDIDY